jgi:cell division protease FtsH
LIQSEIEVRVKTLLAGIVLSDMKYGEHTTIAKNDLDDVKNMVKEMVNEYGMGKHLLSNEYETKEIVDRLYNETRTLLESLNDAIEKVEQKLSKNESITKQEVKEILDEIL